MLVLVLLMNKLHKFLFYHYITYHITFTSLHVTPRLVMPATQIGVAKSLIVVTCQFFGHHHYLMPLLKYHCKTRYNHMLYPAMLRQRIRLR